MTAATVERPTVQMGHEVTPKRLNIPIADNVSVIGGTMVGINVAGACVPGDAGTCVRVVGVAERNYDNTQLGHAAGLYDVEIFQGAFKFGNSASGDEITAADLGNPVYLVDNQTVAKTSDGGDRLVAGLCYGVEGGGVFVQFELVNVETGEAQGSAAAASATARAGRVDLVSGTATVEDLDFGADTEIFLTRRAAGGTLTTTLEYALGTITPGDGDGTIVINAVKADGTVNTADTSTISYLLVG